LKQIRRHLTYANVMSSIAVFLVLGGATAFAASELGKESVGTSQLKKEAVTLAKIKKATKKALKGQAGPQGPQGKQGDRGLQGVPGLSELERVADSTGTSTTTPKTLTISCAPGKKILSSGFDIDGGSTGGKKEAAIDMAQVSSTLESASYEAYDEIGSGTPSWNLLGSIVCAKVG
jgi:hypothetical protein